jgi:exonuclease III
VAKVSYGIGVEEHDGEGRVITVEYPSLYVVTGGDPSDTIKSSAFWYEPSPGDGMAVTVAEIGSLDHMAAYVPNAGMKLERLKYRLEEWNPAFQAYLEGLRKTKPVVLCGEGPLEV